MGEALSKLEAEGGNRMAHRRYTAASAYWLPPR
jgi:hypothetical protein